MYLMSNPLQPFCYNSLGELMCFSQTLSKVQVKTHYRHFASCFVTLPQTKTQGHFTVPSLTDSFYKQVSLDRKHFMTKPMSAAKQLLLRFDKILTISYFFHHTAQTSLYKTFDRRNSYETSFKLLSRLFISDQVVPIFLTPHLT